MQLDNACSAIGKALHFTICGGGPRPLDAALAALSGDDSKSPTALARLFVESLPLGHDDVECRSAVQVLAWRVELGCSLVLGPDGAMVPKVLAVFAYACSNKKVNTAFVRAAVGRAVVVLRRNVPPAILSKALEAVPAKARAVLDAAVEFAGSIAASSAPSSPGAPGTPGKVIGSPGGMARGGAVGSPSVGSPW